MKKITSRADVALLFGTLILASMFLPWEGSPKGHFSDPILDIEENWMLIPIPITLLAVSKLINKINFRIDYGRLMVRNNHLELLIKDSMERIELEQLEYFELTKDNEIYIRTKSKKVYNLKVEPFQDVDKLTHTLEKISRSINK